MIDTVPSFRSPIFDDARPKKLPASFYWGVLFAVLLHLALLYYFFNQNFTLIPVEAPPEGPIYTVEIMPMPKPPEPTVEKQINPVLPHTPPISTPDNVDTLPIAPKPDVVISEPVAGPPVIVQGPVVVAPPGPPAPVFVKARWTRFPDANALGQYYPARAIDNEIEGAATVECTVLDTAGRVSCLAISETPGNYGFGKATVQMVQEKGRIDTSQGDIKVGSKLRATIQWTLGN